MKHLGKWIGKMFFWVMVVALMGYAASRTLDFVSSTLSADDQAIGYLALFATTGGAVAWLLIFLYHSEGMAQKGISVVMAVIDIVGEIVLFTADTMMRSGENGIMTAMHPDDIHLTILAMSALIGANILAAFAFHIASPENMQAIEDHFAEQEIRDAIQQARLAKARQNKGDIAAREAEKYGAALNNRESWDVNGDGQIDIKDLLALLSEKKSYASDVDDLSKNAPSQ